MSEQKLKSERLLIIYSKLSDGKILSKQELAQTFQVNTRSIQRDMESLRCFFSDQGIQQQIIYDHKAGGYRLQSIETNFLTNSEILAVCKILTESRSLRKDEMDPILDKLIDRCVPTEGKAAVKALMANEKFHYIEPHHQKYLLQTLWTLGEAVQNKQVTEIAYQRIKDHQIVTRRVEPVGIMFSEYYFYLTAFLQDLGEKAIQQMKKEHSPSIYRLDRIQDIHVLPEHFSVPYKDRFEEGEFRKRVQFMYGGKLETIHFRYVGPSIDAVLDRLPTAKILSQDENGYNIEAEIFGKGIEMWLRSQGDYVILQDELENKL